MIRNRNKAQTFNDGIVRIYEVKNIAKPPDMPKEELVPKRTLRYKERTVGMNRHYVAMQAGVDVAYVLRVPRMRDVSTQDVAVPNDGEQYEIRQIQYPEDISPPVMDITLQRLEVDYDFA